MKKFAFLFLVPAICFAAIWPETVGEFHRVSASPANPSNKPIWDEYGLKEAETAQYENGPKKFTATVYRLQDTTGSMAAFEWQRPPKSTPSAMANLATETPDSLLVVHGNYLLSFQGYKPSTAELAGVTQSLLNVDSTSLPTLARYLPSQDLVPNSSRYIVGPAGLQAFDPGISPSLAAFHYGAEAQTGVFHSPKGDVTLAIFSYPTPQIAMQQVAEFQKISGAMAKRTGPMVAVVLAPPDPDFSERLLSGIRYQAEVTRDEYVPTRRDNIGNLIVNAFILIGILLAFSVVSGLVFGGFRALSKRGRKGDDADALISLRLE